MIFISSRRPYQDTRLSWWSSTQSWSQGWLSWWSKPHWSLLQFRRYFHVIFPCAAWCATLILSWLSWSWSKQFNQNHHHLNYYHPGGVIMFSTIVLHDVPHQYYHDHHLNQYHDYYHPGGILKMLRYVPAKIIMIITIIIVIIIIQAVSSRSLPLCCVMCHTKIQRVKNNHRANHAIRYQHH